MRPHTNEIVVSIADDVNEALNTAPDTYKISRAWLAGVTFQPAEGKIQAGTCGNLPDPTCSSWNSSPAVLSPASPVTQGTLCGFSVSLRDLPASGPPALVPPSEGRHFLSPIHWALLPTPFLSSSAHLI